jgi:XRE family aerobic/anaerobic benzoate catabolism transcriptional regulator
LPDIAREGKDGRGKKCSTDPGPALAADEAGEAKNPFLVALGERVRELRARRGLTRKAVAQMSEVSERHLANLEYGIGNASILVMSPISSCPLILGLLRRAS